MPTLTEALAQLAASLNIVGVPTNAQPGQLLTASLAPPVSALRFTDLVSTEVNLNFIAKDVVFSNTNFAAPGFAEDPAITKIAPLFNFLTVPPSTDTSGVEGLIGKIKGTLALPVPVEALPKLTVNWRVQDDAGNNLVDGTDFLSPTGLMNAALDVVFLPAFSLFDGSVPPPAKRRIFADVTLTVTGTPPVTQPVGPVEVTIPTIPFPKVLALTLDTNFRGAALVMVPGNSAITTIDQIKTLLQPVRNVISTLTAVTRFAEMLLGINTLANVLEATNFAFRKSNSEHNLNDIDLITRGFFENDTEAEDELSALVYISPPPTKPPENMVEFFNDRDYHTGEGKFTLSTGTSFVALVSNLHSRTPTVAPSSAALVVNSAPPGGWFNPDTFGDELSSIRFL